MSVTAPTDVAQWTPKIISSKMYDYTYASRRSLSAIAVRYDDLEGEPGDSFVIPTINVTSPAENLAVTTAAVDDKLTGGGIPVTVQEGVKSVAFYDRTKWVTGTDFDAVAGQRVGAAQADRIELDLASAIVTNGTMNATVLTKFNVQTIRSCRIKIPSAMRGGIDGTERPILVADDDVLSLLWADPILANAGAFGSDEALREGDFTRPIAGTRLRTLDDNVMPAVGTAGQKYFAVIAPGGLIRAQQKNPTTEPERDARARLTRIVGSQNHAEGVVNPLMVQVFKLDYAAAATAAGY